MKRNVIVLLSALLVMIFFVTLVIKYNTEKNKEIIAKNSEGISDMCNETTNEKNAENYTFGEKGDKTVAEQRKEIYDAMEKAKNTEVKWKEIPEFNPTIEKYSHIKAITYDGLEYKGEKTKVFAYIGFPEGAEENSGVPAVVLIHGGGGHPFLEWVRLWNERGYAAIAMETTGCFPTVVNAGVTEGGNGGEFVYGLTEFFEEDGYISAPGRAYTSEYMEVSEQGPYHAISQVILAGNILRQHPRVDKDSIGITGISWGGVTLAQVIGYDNRFSFAIPVYGMAYLGDEMNPFGKFKDPYVDALWAAERNLDNAADIPILWFAYNDDNNFSINQYVNSFKHTVRFNSKTSLIMLSNWGHSHTWAWTKPESYYFADWITWGNKGFITFESMPEGREINCKINIPENIKGSVSAYFYYITEPMSYSKHNKYGWGSYMFLDQKWEKTKGDLKVDKETGTVTGTVPEDARGYYINISFKAYDGAKERIEVSSVFVPID